MPDPRTRRIRRTLAMCFDAVALAAILLALFTYVRGEDTRHVVDNTARILAQENRAYALRVCVSDNARWAAYLATVRQVSDKRSDGETLQDFHARSQRTDQIVAAISKAVTVNCKEVFK